MKKGISAVKIARNVVAACAMMLMATMSIDAFSDRAAAKAPYFPPVKGEWEKIDPATLGWDASALQDAMAYTCMTNGTGLLVIYEGRIVAEKYCPLEKVKTAFPDNFWKRFYKGANAQGAPLEEMTSINKSVTSFLIGVAVGKGLIDIEKPADFYLGKGWSNASPEQEAAITIRHLLSMQSGLDEELRFLKPAGAGWNYNSAAYSQLQDVLEKVTGKTMTVIGKEWLTDPVGMNETSWTKRPEKQMEGRYGSAYLLVTTPRDLARLGLVMLNGGMWNGKDILHNPGWIKKSTSPSQDYNTSYGMLWWLNGHKSIKVGEDDETKEELIPTAPDDLFAAQGGNDRRLYVVPSRSLVVVRFGHAAGGPVFSRKLWWHLMQAMPANPQ